MDAQPESWAVCGVDIPNFENKLIAITPKGAVGRERANVIKVRVVAHVTRLKAATRLWAEGLSTNMATHNPDTSYSDHQRSAEELEGQTYRRRVRDSIAGLIVSPGR
jgi:hypothetical protein